MKKFVSLGDIDEAIRLLESYKEEHDPEGEIYYALAIATYIMKKNLHEVFTDLMYTERVAKYDS